MANRSLHMWDVTTGQKLQEMPGPSSLHSRCLAVSPDGSRIVVGTGTFSSNPQKEMVPRDCKLHLVDVARWQVKISSPEQSSPILCAAFSPDGSKIATGHNGVSIRDANRTTYRDCDVTIWDAQSGKPVKVCAGHTRAIRAVAFSPDGRRLYSFGSDRDLRIWDVDTGKELASRACPAGMSTTRAIFTPDRRHLLATSQNRVVLWEVETGKVTNGANLNMPPGIGALSLSVDERYLVASSYGNPKKENDKHVTRPDGTLVFADCIIHLIDWQSGKELARAEKHTSPVRALAITPDGRYAVSSGDDKVLIVWDLTR
jgi:WD40 repeat protein